MAQQITWHDVERRRPHPLHRVALLEAAVSAGPTTELRVELAQTLAQLGEFERAADVATEVLANEPDVVPAIVVLGHSLVELERFEVGLEQLERAAVSGPSTFVETLRGRALLGLRRWDEAEAVFGAAADAAPTNGPALRLHVEALFRRGAYDEALTVAERRCAVAPLSTVANAMRIVALRAVGDHERADALEDIDRLLWQGELAMDAQSIEAARTHVLQSQLLRRFESYGVTRDAGRIDQLFADDSPAVVALSSAVHAAIDSYVAATQLRSAPSEARLRGWANVFGAAGHELAHVHARGRISGVCYLGTAETNEVPASGTLHFGRATPGLAAGDRPAPITVVPKVGMVVVFPSWYYHHTTAPGVADERISVAFDVEPIDD